MLNVPLPDWPSEAAQETALGPRHPPSATPTPPGPRTTVLEMLSAAAEPIGVAELAVRLGQHPNTVREHLDALIRAGCVQRVRSRPSGRGRPAWLYRVGTDAAGRAARDAVSGVGFAGGGEEYAALAMALIEQLATNGPEARTMAVGAGARWGRSLADRQGSESAARAGGDDPQDPGAPLANTAVVTVLENLRFTPRTTDNERLFRLTTCPLLDAARRQPELVCSVHLGIVRGVLEQLGGDPDATDLVPFAEPGACLLTLPPRRCRS